MSKIPQPDNDVCSTCIHFRPSGDKTGLCRCWHVKDEDGDYVRVRQDAQACDYYMPRYVSMNFEP